MRRQRGWPALLVALACAAPEGLPDGGDEVGLDEQRSCPDASERGCGTAFIDASPQPFRLGHVGLPGDPNEPGFDVNVSAFHVDTHEVTVARFRRFVPSLATIGVDDSIVLGGGATIGYQALAGAQYTAGMPLPSSAGGTWSATPGALEHHPITAVTWGTAMAFCRWDAGGRGRLPTEAELEYLARFRTAEGLERDRAYAWGDAPVQVDPSGCDRAQVTGCPGPGGQATRPVGSFPSTGGLFDLTGNVAEWPLDSYHDYPPYWCLPGRGFVIQDPYCMATKERAVRGGSFVSERYETWRRDQRPGTNDRPVDVGFRCVRSVPSP